MDVFLVLKGINVKDLQKNVKKKLVKDCSVVEVGNSLVLKKKVLESLVINAQKGLVKI